MAKMKKLITGVALFTLFSAGAEAKLFKWVDEKGETHYGEVIPPEYANREAQQLEKGKVTKKEAPKGKEPIQKETPLSQAAIDQQRHDAALLGTYSSEQEIDLARDRNLQQVDARTNSIKLRLSSAQTDLQDLRKERDGLAKAGKPVPKSLDDDIGRADAKVTRLQGDLNQSQGDADALKARYEADKQRYRSLKGIDQAASAPAAAPAK